MDERCEHCKGSGYVQFDARFEQRRYCACPMGVDIRRVDKKLSGQMSAREIDERGRKLFGYEISRDYKSRAAGDSE
jgi:hypothetical protein